MVEAVLIAAAVLVAATLLEFAWAVFEVLREGDFNDVEL